MADCAVGLRRRAQAYRALAHALAKLPQEWQGFAYESLYRHGHLAGPVTWELERFYRSLHLEPASGELPDNASVELTLMALLLEAEAEAHAGGDKKLAQRAHRLAQSFFREHINAWMPQLANRLAHSGEASCVEVARLLEELLASELKQWYSHQGMLCPELEEPDLCTLCGLCTGICPTGALEMREDERETSLFFNGALCTGCGLCVRKCPVKALRMYPKAEGMKKLRTSPRVRCPACGAPTVSEAELEDVFHRLGANERLKERLRLCPSCKIAGWR